MNTLSRPKYHEYVSLEELSLNEDLSIEILSDIRSLFMAGSSMASIDRLYNLGYSKMRRICIVFLYNDTLRNATKRGYIGHDKRYWHTEDEMIIQHYKIEDLKGDELLILNELKKGSL